jgi:hypothetical protein
MSSRHVCAVIPLFLIALSKANKWGVDPVVSCGQRQKASSLCQSNDTLGEVLFFSLRRATESEDIRLRLFDWLFVGGAGSVYFKKLSKIRNFGRWGNTNGSSFFSHSCICFFGGRNGSFSCVSCIHRDKPSIRVCQASYPM